MSSLRCVQQQKTVFTLKKGLRGMPFAPPVISLFFLSPIGCGIAMPHTKHRSVKRNVGTVAISAEGIDFDCLDEEKAQLFFLVLSPPDFPGDHLRVMCHLTERLKNDTFCQSLKQSKTREAIFALLEEDDSSERR